MRKFLLAGLACVFMCSAAFASDGIDPLKRALIDELLEITGALDVGEQMAGLMTTQMTNSLRSVNNTLPDRAFELLEEEIINTISEEIERGTFKEMMYPIYDRHFTSEDLEIVIEFYRSDVGRKFTAALPQMTQESMAVGQRWGAEIGKKAAARVEERLAAEGFKITE